MERFLYIGLIQLAVNFISDYFSVILEVTQNIPTMRVFKEEPIRMFAWEFVNYIQMLSLILCSSSASSLICADVNRTLPFKPFCSKYLDPCSCVAGIDFSLFNTTCNGTHAQPLF